MRTLHKIPLLFGEVKKSAKDNGVGPLRILFEILLLKYWNGIGVTDYFVGELYRQRLSLANKLKYLGNKQYDKLLDVLNPPRLRTVTTNKLYEKTLFTSLGLPTPRYVGHLHPEFGKDRHGTPLRSIDDLKTFLRAENLPGCVLKPVDSYGGHGIKFLNMDDGPGQGDQAGAWSVTRQSEIAKTLFFNSSGYVCEEKVKQHPALNALNPASLNTLRVWIVKKPEYRILGAFIRMAARDIPVDNVTSGGLFARVDASTGKIVSHAVMQDFPVRTYPRHPVTGVELTSVRVPFWDEALGLCRELAFYYPGLSLIAFDIAIAEDGPVCVESNCGDPRGQFKIDFGFGALKKA